MRGSTRACGLQLAAQAKTAASTAALIPATEVLSAKLNRESGQHESSAEERGAVMFDRPLAATSNTGDVIALRTYLAYGPLFTPLPAGWKDVFQRAHMCDEAANRAEPAAADAHEAAERGAARALLRAAREARRQHSRSS